MKVKVTKSYSCERCGKPYRYDDRGKEQAERCCSCSNCGEPNDRYMGTADKVCSKCKDAGRWRLATENITRALPAYEVECRMQNKRDPEVDKLIEESHAAIGRQRAQDAAHPGQHQHAELGKRRTPRTVHQGRRSGIPRRPKG